MLGAQVDVERGTKQGTNRKKQGSCFSEEFLFKDRYQAWTEPNPDHGWDQSDSPINKHIPVNLLDRGLETGLSA